MADSIEKPAFESPKLSKEGLGQLRTVPQSLSKQLKDPKFMDERSAFIDERSRQRAELAAEEMKDKVNTFYVLQAADNIGFDPGFLTLSTHPSVKEKAALCRGMLSGFIDDPKHFQQFYRKTRNKFTVEQKEYSKEQSHTVFLKEGYTFLSDLLDNVLAVYVQKFQEENPSAPKDLTKRVLDYVRDPKVSGKLLHYDQLDEASKLALYQNFKATCGLDNLPEGNVKVLFEDVVKSLQTQAFEAQRYFSSYHAMLNKIEDAKGQGISDEEWEQMLEEEQAKADKENQSAANENQGFPLNLEVQNIDPSHQPIVSSAGAAARFGAKRVESYDPENGHYTLVLPGEVRVEMSIDTIGASGFSDQNARYTFYDSNSDHGKVTVPPRSLRLAGNCIRLDALATDVLLRRMPQFHQAYNKELNDAQLADLSTKLFGRSIDHAALTEKEIHLFEKFMNILVNPDVNPTFYGPATDDFGSRVAKALIVLSSEGTVGKIQTALKDETLPFDPNHLSSVNFTEFLKQIGYRDTTL
ncbi:MAG: hypothetical protein WC843_01075 [Candidatus Gracilibacteria bacterium]|jgi:hypothetical protein